jgi:cytidylate kinase
MPPQCRVILISGFTAAGKTTYARLLAEGLGWDYIGMSALRRAGFPRSVLGEHEWLPAVDAFRSASPESDKGLDRLMGREILASTRPLVVDAWLQPWLCSQSDALRIWLESDWSSRLLKAIVSHLRRGHRPPTAWVADQIRSKDQFSVDMFESLYGIRFRYDASLFDFSIDNSRYIRMASIHASDRGIAEFQPELERTVKSYF